MERVHASDGKHLRPVLLGFHVTYGPPVAFDAGPFLAHEDVRVNLQLEAAVAKGNFADHRDDVDSVDALLDYVRGRSETRRSSPGADARDHGFQHRFRMRPRSFGEQQHPVELESSAHIHVATAGTREPLEDLALHGATIAGHALVIRSDGCPNGLLLADSHAEVAVHACFADDCYSALDMGSPSG